MSYQSIQYTPDAEVNIDSMAAQQSANVFIDNVHVKQLFTTPDGKALMFHIPEAEPLRSKYIKMIIDNGGVVTDNNISQCIILSSTHLSNGYNIQWLHDSINQGFVGNLKLYQFQSIPEPRQKPKERGHNRFNQDKDEFIIKNIRLNPRYRNSHVFFNKLAESDILKGHTGNSVRSRYRNHLQSQITWVYDIDEHDQIKRDVFGHKLKIEFLKFQGTLKNNFTPQHDYLLCVEAAKVIGLNINFENENFNIDDFYYQHIKLINDSSSLSSNSPITYSFFDKMYRLKPIHSLHSWRDRFRKYVSLELIPNYIKYYEKCVRMNILPKNLPRKLEFTKKVLTARITHELARNDTAALDEEIGETANSNIDEVLSIQVPKLEMVTPDDDMSEDISDDDDEDLDEFDTAKERHDDNLERIESSPIQSGQVPESQHSSQVQSDSQIPIHLHYVKPDIRVIDLFDIHKLTDDAAKFGNNGDYTLDVKARIRSCSTLDEIYAKLRSIGFKDEFIGHLALSTNVDTKYMSEYLEIVFNRIFKHVQQGKKTPIAQELDVTNQAGIWNISYDNLLDSNEDLLLEVHSKDLIRKRKRFLTENIEIIDGYDDSQYI